MKMMSKKLASKILDDGGYIVDGKTGEQMTGSDLDLMFSGKRIEGRNKVYYHKFVRINTDQYFIKLEQDLKPFEFKMLVLCSRTANGENRVEFDGIGDRVNEQTFLKARTRLRALGFIDKIKIGHSASWYLNPYYGSRAKTLPNALFSHFQGRFPSMIKALKASQEKSKK